MHMQPCPYYLGLPSRAVKAAIEDCDAVAANDLVEAMTAAGRIWFEVTPSRDDWFLDQDSQRIPVDITDCGVVPTSFKVLREVSGIECHAIGTIDWTTLRTMNGRVVVTYDLNDAQQ